MIKNTFQKEYKKVMKHKIDFNFLRQADIAQKIYFHTMILREM